MTIKYVRQAADDRMMPCARCKTIRPIAAFTIDRDSNNYPKLSQICNICKSVARRWRAPATKFRRMPSNQSREITLDCDLEVADFGDEDNAVKYRANGHKDHHQPPRE